MPKRIFCAVLAAVSLPVLASTVELKDRSILIDGRKTRILAGAMHYFRVPRACWRDRLLKARAMGLNAVETYLCWNLHERRRGEFDFSDNLDFEAYVRLAQELGLHVILRPGPYICGEWDNGVIPEEGSEPPRRLRDRTAVRGICRVRRAPRVDGATVSERGFGFSLSSRVAVW